MLCRRTVLLSIVALFSSTSACLFFDDAVYCDAETPCASGLACVEGVCAAAHVAPDSGEPDDDDSGFAIDEDAGLDDAGAHDAGADAGTTSEHDAGSGDAGAEQDAGEHASDGGLVVDDDAGSDGDAGTPEQDAGSDAGPPLDPPAAPVLSLDVLQTKTFELSWTPSEGADGYRVLEDESGMGAFVEIASALTETSHRVLVPLHLRAKARYVVEACNQAGCTPSDDVEVTTSLAEGVGYIKASNADAHDEFGHRVSLSRDGRTLAVAAPTEDSAFVGIDGTESNNGFVDAGAVYLYVRDDDGDWTKAAYVKASNTGAGDHFGAALALSGDGRFLAVGASDEASGATGVGGNQLDNSATSSGAVYVFARDDDGAWSQVAYVKASNAESGDRFGTSVAFSDDGSTLAVGALYEDGSSGGVNGQQGDNGANDAGAVYVFTRSTQGTYSQSAYLKAAHPTAGDSFGHQVALSGDGRTLAVGAYNEDSAAVGIDGNDEDESATDSGAVSVFTRALSGVWSQAAYVKASNTDASDWFGWDLALSHDGQTLAVGAVSEDSAATGVNGNEASNGSLHSGAVYVFARDGMTFAQVAYVKASNTGSSDHFCVPALSDDGRVLAVSAHREDSAATGIDGSESSDAAIDSGAVYVFERDENGTFAQRAYVKPTNTHADMVFGQAKALKISGDGTTLVVGAYTESGAGVGVNADDTVLTKPRSGAVYIY